MPSSKQGGGYTLTFAQKNMDVKKVLDDKKENKVKITDYLCDAVRFYEKNKNNINKNRNGLSAEEIEKLIDEKIKDLQLKSEEAITDIKNYESNLETNLEYVNIDDD